VWPPDFRSSCSVCGAAPIGPFELTTRAAVGIGLLMFLFLILGLALILCSSDTRTLGFILLVVAALCPLGFLHIWLARKRTKKMAQIAYQMGFAFIPNLTAATVLAVAPFTLLARGSERKAYHGMQGCVDGCGVFFFEYRYTIGGGDAETTLVHSAVLLFDGADGVPDFILTPRTIFDKLVGLLSQVGVELEDAGEFAKRYKIAGPDEAALRKVFNPDLVRCLASDGKWFIQALNGQLLLLRSPKVQPDKVPGLMTDALKIRDKLRAA
jgi:hypothetical protein